MSRSILCGRLARRPPGRLALTCLALVSLALAAPGPVTALQGPAEGPFDLLVVGGPVLDGTGNP